MRLLISGSWVRAPRWATCFVFVFLSKFNGIVFLNRNNLLNLALEAEKLNLHNHNYKDYKELYKTENDVIYFCGHCCST